MKEILHTAMQQLANVCDGASSEDGMGFSKGDSYNGKFLASQNPEKWTMEETLLACHYATKYRGQLGNYEEIKDAIRTLEGNANEHHTQYADKVSEKRRKSYNKPIATAKYENGLIVTDTPTRSVDFGFVSASKEIPSRRYMGGSFTSFRPEHLKQVLELCENYEIEVLFNPSDVVVTTTTIAPTPVITEKKVTLANGKIVITFPYSFETKELVRNLGAAWDKEVKTQWLAEPVMAQRIIDGLKPAGFIIDSSLDGLVLQSVHNKENYNLSTTDFYRDVPQIRPEYKVLPHQWVPIEWALKNNNMLNADSQGLGKTFVTLTTAIIKGAKRTVVICPSSLTGNWDAESQMFYTEGTFKVFHAEGRTVSEIPEDANLVIIGWPNLSFWINTINDWKADVIVVDEAHYGKSGKGSQRGKAFIELGKKNKKAMKLALTGTPILNRPLELLAILNFFDVQKLFGGNVKFKNRYCGPEIIHTEYGSVTTYNGAENLDELNDILTSSGLYVRRTKKLLMEQGLLKNKYVNGVEFFSYDIKRTPTYLKLTAEEQAEYNSVEREFKEKLELKRRELAREMGLSPNHPKVVNAVTSNKGGDALVLLNEFRRRIGFLKIRAIKEHVNTLVAQGEKVVIFAHHRDVVDAYAEEFSSIKIQGGMGVKKIEEAKRKFNATPIEEHPVLVVSIEAGKTGHTLCLQKKNGVGQNCAYAIFAEEPYVYGDAEQAEDRIYRIGQDREVFIDNLLVANTVDERIYKIRENKRKVFNAIIDGVNLEDDDEESVAKQILKAYI